MPQLQMFVLSRHNLAVVALENPPPSTSAGCQARRTEDTDLELQQHDGPETPTGLAAVAIGNAAANATPWSHRTLMGQARLAANAVR
jgi:hypothetical protein